MAQFNRSLPELTEPEIYQALAQEGKHVSFSYADLENELERRRNKLATKRSFVISVISLIIAALSILSSIIIAYFNNRHR